MAAEKMPAERAALWACKAACERIIDQYDGVTAGIDWNALLGSVDRALYTTPPAPTTEPTAKPITGLTEEEAYAMQMLWDDQPLEEKAHYLAVARRALGLAVQGGES